ncbi:exocyst complex component exo70 [Orbilia blumenaviensis]|uniref:Exocyst complex protein EXO70 n=1 Tax=Orbilia blumenaviensis TaxID=1796055 RepID=A0AAV9UN15_9PEZI
MAVLPEEEAAEVEVLNERLKKMTTITDKISRSLTKLSGSAQQVEMSVQPILMKTGSLTALAGNIDAGIFEIDKTMKLLDLVKHEENTIRKGPQVVGLPDYLNSVKRLSEGLAALQSTGLKAAEKAVKEMTLLLKTGSVQLEDQFKKSLAQESTPCEPLHFITKKLPFPTFNPEKLKTIAIINEFLSSTIGTASASTTGTAASSASTSATQQAAQSSAINIYSDVRGTYISSSLSSLSQGCVNTATRRNTSVPYEKGDNGISHYAQAIEGIFSAEYDNIQRLFKPNLWLKVYTATTQQALTVFSNTVRQLNKHIVTFMITDCYLAFDVIECVTATATRLGTKTGEKNEFVEALKPIRQTASASFFEILEDLKRKGNSMAAVPLDATVSEYTQANMARLRRLTDYQTAVAGLLISLGDKNWNSPYSPTLAANQQSFDVGADGNVLLANYCMECIDRMLEILEGKGKLYIKKQQQCAVFMVNNVAYVETSIKRGGLVSVLSLGGGIAKVEKWRKKAVEEYMIPWKEAAGYLLDMTYTSKAAITVAASGSKPSLTSKDKEAIKEKFKNFNTLFDTLISQHKSYVFPDKEVKGMLFKEITFISPLYGRFWDKYHEVVKDKHVKYDVAALQSVLASCQ